MYEHINKKKPAGSIRMVLLLIACVLIIAAVLALIIWSGFYITGYRDFVADLSNSTYYAYQNNSLYAINGPDKIRIKTENIYLIYTRITDAGSGRIGKMPAEEPEVTLVYGDGSYMELWMVELENSRTERTQGLFISYVNSKGERYSYDSDKLDIDSLPLGKWTNTPDKLK